MAGDDRDMGKEISKDGHRWLEIVRDDAGIVIEMGTDDPR